MIDYRTYSPGPREQALFYAAAISCLGSLGLLYYRSFAAFCLCALLAVPCKPYWASYMRKKRQERLLEGFRDMLYTISSAVAAGRQLPMAVEEAAAALKGSWGENSDIYKEASHMASVYRETHGDPDALWEDFALRSGLGEIRRFAESCRICRRNGGNLEDVCFKCSNLLLERISLKEEMKALWAEKKLETRILALLPPGVLILLNLTSYGYVEALYTTLAGRLIMTASLGLLGAAVFMSSRLLEAEI